MSNDDYSFFTLDDEGDEDIELTESTSVKKKKKKGVNIPESILDDPEIKEVCLFCYCIIIVYSFS